MHCICVCIIIDDKLLFLLLAIIYAFIYAFIYAIICYYKTRPSEIPSLEEERQIRIFMYGDVLFYDAMKTRLQEQVSIDQLFMQEELNSVTLEQKKIVTECHEWLNVSSEMHLKYLLEMQPSVAFPVRLPQYHSPRYLPVNEKVCRLLLLQQSHMIEYLRKRLNGVLGD